MGNCCCCPSKDAEEELEPDYDDLVKEAAEADLEQNSDEIRDGFTKDYNTEETPLTSGLADFAWNLMKRAGAETENVLLSPISISVALAMLYAGADGTTAAEMEKVVFRGIKGEGVHEGFNSLLPFLSSTEEVLTLNSANRIYVKKGFQLLKKFTETLSKFYDSELKAVDFNEATRQQINAWVEEATKEKIKDLIPPGILDDDDTYLVLVNAIYFKGRWKKEFDVECTHSKVFFNSAYTKTDEGFLPTVEMMWQEERLLFAETDTIKVLGLPFRSKEHRLTFLAFLPTKKCGLAEVEAQMSGEKMVELIRMTKFETVIVELPKFKLEQSMSLNSALSGLGMAEVFDKEKADFSKITGGRGLHVSDVIHKAFIEVNECGSEAAAATAVEVFFFLDDGPQIRPPPKEFIADHPFLFGIFAKSDKAEIVPLFLGRYTGK